MAVLASIQTTWRSVSAESRRQSRLPRIVCWLLIVCGSLFPLRAETQNISPEYKVKAAFLFNFAQFVEWPPEAFGGRDAPLVIGILGSDPFGGFLDETVKGENVGGRKLEVRRFARANEVSDCQILFISQSEMARLKGILASLHGKPVLTVGDSENFASRGGMIRFLMEQNRIRLRINLTAAQESRLTISSKLLRAAEIVRTEKD